ncbi:MAG: InlB B-repeat-containing protein, partial [Actinomycetes bacterium]
AASSSPSTLNLVPHTVTFAANGGKGSTRDQKSSNAEPLHAATFYRTGYSFAGWSTKADGSGTNFADGATYSFSSDVIVYAQWKPVRYTVTFDSSGASGQPVAISFDFGSAISLPGQGSMTYPGYAFKGWKTSLGSPTILTGSYSPAGSVTLLAVWQSTARVNVVPTSCPDGQILIDGVCYAT